MQLSCCGNYMSFHVIRVDFVHCSFLWTYLNFHTQRKSSLVCSFSAFQLFSGYDAVMIPIKTVRFFLLLSISCADKTYIGSLRLLGVFANFSCLLDISIVILKEKYHYIHGSSIRLRTQNTRFKKRQMNTFSIRTAACFFCC
jgi:hypothetical protein